MSDQAYDDAVLMSDEKPKRVKGSLSTSELSELRQQATVVSLLKRSGICYASIPNGHVRSKRQNIQAMHEGVIAGMPDLLIFDRPPALPHAIGVALEMKRLGGRSRDVKPEQLAQLKRLAIRGWVPAVGYGASDAIALLCALGYFPNLHLAESQIPHLFKYLRFVKLVAEQAPTSKFARINTEEPE